MGSVGKGVVAPEPASTAQAVSWLCEQLDAAKDIIHTYKCVYCQIASATKTVLVIDTSEENKIVDGVQQGPRVTLVGMCDTCLEEE